MNDLFNSSQTLDPTYFYAGLLGKTTQNIPSSLEWTFDLQTPYSSDYSSIESDIICSMDGDSNITHINISDWFHIYYEYDE